MWENSYTNYVMLLATIPKYKKKGGDGKPGEQVTESDDFMSLSDFIKTK